MRVKIVCYEYGKSGAWIFEKFANRLNENLSMLGIASDIGNKPDPAFDINHHIFHADFNCIPSSIDTLMVTHIDTIAKLQTLKKQLSVADMGICMSRDTMVKLVNAGLPREKLCFVNPAHDGAIKPRPKIVGHASRVQNDGRKREHLLAALANHLEPGDFSFKIMGQGWSKCVGILRSGGFQVEYCENFDYAGYAEMIRSLDYYLYMGQDEGHMGFIDALAAGVPTIVTPQGYHLDARDGISYGFNSETELIDVFRDIAGGRRKLTDAVADWTWCNYAKKHVQIWNYLIETRFGKKRGASSCARDFPFISNSGDGLPSLGEFDAMPFPVYAGSKRIRYKVRLLIHYFASKYHFIKSNNNVETLGQTLKKVDSRTLKAFFLKY